MLVLKFGGSSLSSAENIRQIKNILAEKPEKFILVLSAMGKTTNKLHALADAALENKFSDKLEDLRMQHINTSNELLKPVHQPSSSLKIQQYFFQLENICSGIATLQELSEKTLAQVLGFGEKLSSAIVHQYLLQEGFSINYLDSTQFIKAEGNYLNAEVDLSKTESLIQNHISGKENYITQGFISSNSKEELTLLGRGGSDFTASIYASSVQAGHLEIWSDVNGMMNANPQTVKNAITIPELSYEEAFELAYFGAKVLYPPTIRPVMQKNISIYLKNTFQPENKGTIIHQNSDSNKLIIKGITSLSDLSMLTISGVGLAGVKGTARRVFQTMEEANINIILITQGSSEQSIGLGIKSDKLEVAIKALEEQFENEMQRQLINPIQVLENQAIIAVVGDAMKHHIGLSGKIFGVLGESGINITAIAQGASERNISMVISQEDEEKALNAIHRYFFQVD